MNKSVNNIPISMKSAIILATLKFVECIADVQGARHEASLPFYGNMIMVSVRMWNDARGYIN